MNEGQPRYGEEPRKKVGLKERLKRTALIREVQRLTHTRPLDEGDLSNVVYKRILEYITESELKLPIKIEIYGQFFVISPDGTIKSLDEHFGSTMDWENKVSQAQQIRDRLSTLNDLALNARQLNELYFAEMVLDIDTEIRNLEITVIENRIQRLES